MEAESRTQRPRCANAFFPALILAVMVFGGQSTLDAADYRTRNFIVSANSPFLAKQVAMSAERYRSELAKYWLGTELRPWPTPCPIRVNASPRLAAQGVTTYNRAPVRDFQMEVTGSQERILDSVLPHEVTHTVLATYFGRPLPRWADEGICTTVEHPSEKAKHEAKLREFLRTRRGIAMNQLFLLTEYPNDILPMYAQGYSVCQFLIAQQGPRTFIQFLKDYVERPSWTANIQKHYGYSSLRELQEYWLKWVDSGSGDVEKFAVNRTQAASALVANLDRAQPKTNTLNPPQSRSTIASNNQPLTQTPAKGTALSEVAQAGWYMRQRQIQAQREQETASPSMASVASPIVPPSIRKSGRYSVAQPQGEPGRPSQPVMIGGNSSHSWR